MNMLSTRPSRTRRAAERHGGRAPCSFVGLRLIVTEAVPPVAMAGCSARMLDAAVAALDAVDAPADTTAR